jgi:predicted transposase/invertase (TIGR01784 family)
MTFVDIKNDIAFRKIFGNENKKIILISFINAVLHLEGTKRIKAITIANPFQLPILPNMKTSIIDVKATDFRGNTFIIEMQVADIMGMDKRLLYYTSKEYSQQIVSGEKYTELNPVIFIGIFDFNFTKGTDYFSHHAICNVKTQERLIKDMDFYFIELSKFLLLPKDLNNVIDKWIYFIKESENLDVIPDNLEDEGLKEAYLDANKNTWTKEELNAYDYAAMREQDERGRMEKAMLQAKEKTIYELVMNMQSEGIPIVQIAKIAKLTVEEVTDIVEKFDTP